MSQFCHPAPLTLTWTHCTGFLWSPLRTQTFWPFSEFQMWILPSLEPEMTNWESGENEASSGSCLELRWPVKECKLPTCLLRTCVFLTCEGLKGGSVVWVNEFDHLSIGGDQNTFPVWGELQSSPLQFFAVDWLNYLGLVTAIQRGLLTDLEI